MRAKKADELTRAAMYATPSGACLDLLGVTSFPRPTLEYRINVQQNLFKFGFGPTLISYYIIVKEQRVGRICFLIPI